MLEALSRIHQSYSVAFADYVRNREAAGNRIVKMQTGDPDFATHPHIIEIAHRAMRNGETKYCDSRGLISLREALCEKLAAENGINASPLENILITHGAIHGIGLAIRAVVNPGDEIVIQEPFWRAYEADVILSGGTPIIVQARRETGFQLEAEQILQKITPRTRAVLVNTPNNPSGAIYSRRELTRLAAECASRGVYFISDEVYEAIVFDNQEHYSAASDPAIFPWSITAFSFSKTYAMTGWRVGYLVASKILIDEILKLSQFSVTSLSPFIQRAAVAALTESEVRRYAKRMRDDYQARRSMVAELIAGTWLEGAMLLPSGTFYALIDVSRFNMPSLDLAKKIVDFANVSFTPGIAFGNSMDNYLRMCFAASDENIRRAVKALIDFERRMPHEL